jgi:histidine triad (HIT) family protein
MDDCLFCKIVKGEIPSTKVYEDELCYAFRDINPQAPVHVVLVPKKHVSGMNEVDGLTDAEIAGLLRAVKKIAAREHIDQSGYRAVSNCGKNACQSVQHLHIHILGGVQMADKMS